MHTVDSLNHLAAVLALDGRAAAAARLLSSSMSAYEEIGITVPRYIAKRNEETLATIRAQLDEPVFAEAWQQGRTMTADEAVALALDSPKVKRAEEPPPNLRPSRLAF